MLFIKTMNELITNNKCGYLEIILGPMFSGKTSRIINLYKQYKILDTNVLVINHTSDNRYGSDVNLYSHDNIKIFCYKYNYIKDMINSHFDLLNKSNVVILINEGQFFEDLYNSVDYLVNIMNQHVYVCGLDGDYKTNKFGQIIDLIPKCDKVYKLTSICSECNDGTKAIFSHRKTIEKQQKIIGSDNYQPLCRKCYNLKNKQDNKGVLSIDIPDENYLEYNNSLMYVPPALKRPSVMSNKIFNFDSKDSTPEKNILHQNL